MVVARKNRVHTAHLPVLAQNICVNGFLSRQGEAEIRLSFFLFFFFISNRNLLREK